VEILSYIVLHLVLNRVGRKRPYFVAVFCFAVIALLTIPVQNLMAKDDPSKRSDVRSFPLRLSLGKRILIFSMNVLLKFFAAGSYAIIYIYANELFPTGIRNTGMGICSMVASEYALVFRSFPKR
jgi:MFS family permease